MKPPVWEAYNVQKYFKGSLFSFSLDIKVWRFWGADPGRSMGGGRGISRTFPFPSPELPSEEEEFVNLWCSSVGRKVEETLKLLGKGKILIFVIATVGELRHKSEIKALLHTFAAARQGSQSFPDDGELPSCLDVRVSKPGQELGALCSSIALAPRNCQSKSFTLPGLCIWKYECLRM